MESTSKLTHKEFVTAINNDTIKPWVDINKGHALMKTSFAPRSWRYTVIILTWITIMAFPVSIVLFFFVNWWIPVLIIFFSFLFMKAIREESVKAVIKISLEEPDFYEHAILSGTMKAHILTEKDTAENSPRLLSNDIYHSYLAKKKADPMMEERGIAKIIFSERYSIDNKLYSLAESNKEHIVDLQTLIYAVLNMEFKDGRNLDTLAGMYYEALKALNNLGHLPAIQEFQSLQKIMRKASENDFDEVEAAKMAIKGGFMHRRDDFDSVVSEIFEK
jgi:hypothetical protein